MTESSDKFHLMSEVIKTSHLKINKLVRGKSKSNRNCKDNCHKNRKKEGKHSD